MKKHFSVFMLCERAVLYRVLLVTFGMTAAELSFFCLFIKGKTAQPFSDKNLLAPSLCFLAAYFLIAGICGGVFGRHSRFGYTLQRLRISEYAVFLWQALANALMFFLLYGMQVVILFVFARLYAAQTPVANNVSGIFLDFYRSPFLHAVVPLSETVLWVRNAVDIIALGVGCSYLSLKARYGGKSSFAFELTLVTVATSFRTEIGNGYFVTLTAGLLVGITAAVCVLLAWFTAHTGKRREDDEDNEAVF